MKKLKSLLYLLVGIIGGISFYIGEFIITSERWKNVSGMCIGLGSAIFCLGIGSFIIELFSAKSKMADLERRKNIEVNDERNIRIREKAGSTTLRLVNYALSAIILALGFMPNNLIPILLLASVFLMEFILIVILSNNYAKRM